MSFTKLPTHVSPAYFQRIKQDNVHSVKTFFALQNWQHFFTAELILLQSMITLSLSLSLCTSLLFNVFFLTFWSINSNIRSTVHAQSVHGIFTFSFLAWNIRSEFLFSHKFQNVKFNWAGLDWNNWFHDEFWILTPLHCVPTNWSKETNINWGYFHFIMRLTSPIKQYSVGTETYN